MKKEEKIIPKNPINTAKRLYSFIKPYRTVYFTGWFFLILSSLSALTFPMLMGQLLGADKNEAALINLGDLDFNNINVVLLALLIVFASQSVFSFLRIVLFNQVTEKVLRDIKIQAFQKLTMLPIDFYNKNKVGELTSRIATDVQLLQETFNTTLAEFFRQLLTIAVAIVF
ncbi:MAG: ABC transporter ATP-binding protein, partial [Crocinitomicaceae bacterium]|nr:ABC transporter ATP-binding protein [Crocinitomicaceae bacterium]